MAQHSLIVTGGDVIEVQLTSETVVIDGERHVAGGHITNRMRLFVRDDEGKESKYDFEDTELGVRETQRVAVVRGRLKGVKEPVNLILFNLSSGEHDTCEDALEVYLHRRPFFTAPWKAAGCALFVALMFWIYNNVFTDNASGGLTSVVFALMIGFLTYPVFWWLCALWDRVRESTRYARARKAFIADMAGRARAYGSRAPATAPAPTASAPPSSAEPSGA
jgi:hypothetical protein